MVSTVVFSDFSEYARWMNAYGRGDVILYYTLDRLYAIHADDQIDLPVSVYNEPTVDEIEKAKEYASNAFTVDEVNL